jgi:hypothetical protein
MFDLLILSHRIGSQGGSNWSFGPKKETIHLTNT